MCFNITNASNPLFSRSLSYFCWFILSDHLWHYLDEFLEWHETHENLERSNLLTV